jgi:glycosyltransferase involved in cell wall biosynthesis
MVSLTVFIGTFNRLTTLDRTVKSFERMGAGVKLVIVDNGSDHPDCIDFLHDLKRQRRVYKVCHLPRCDVMDELAENFNTAMTAEFETTKSKWFAVSEADVCFDGTDPQAFEAYIALAKHTGRAAGPHLRVDKNIPACYPLRSRVLACETWMLYHGDMLWFDGIPYSQTQIDTTFHLFPTAPRFKRLHMDPLRVGPPYDAMHLDWYMDVFNPVPENAIYISGQWKVGSWGKDWIRNYWQWYQTEGPERAAELLRGEPMNLDDLCVVSFTHSWIYQYGIGVEADHDTSVDWLRSAIPGNRNLYWDKEADWMAMVYDNDFAALGWNERDATD